MKKLLIIIYTNYLVVILIFKQISLIILSTNKLNLRLFNLTIKYKSSVFNIILNTLLYLQRLPNLLVGEKVNILDYFYNITIPLSITKYNAIFLEIFTFYITLIKIIDSFKKYLEKAYIEDK